VTFSPLALKRSCALPSGGIEGTGRSRGVGLPLDGARSDAARTDGAFRSALGAPGRSVGAAPPAGRSGTGVAGAGGVVLALAGRSGAGVFGRSTAGRSGGVVPALAGRSGRSVGVTTAGGRAERSDSSAAGARLGGRNDPEALAGGRKLGVPACAGGRNEGADVTGRGAPGRLAVTFGAYEREAGEFGGALGVGGFGIALEAGGLGVGALGAGALGAGALGAGALGAGGALVFGALGAGSSRAGIAASDARICCERSD
jgi:hypothetical protein